MKTDRQRQQARATIGIGIPLFIIWATGFYVLFRSTQHVSPDVSLRGWILGLLLVGCSTFAGLQLKQCVDRARQLEARAKTEEWSCSVEDGVTAVVTALHDTELRNRPRIAKRGDSNP